ncbi:Gfo/Idh/MocA family oxidoreductase [Spirochaetota bacterium]
MNKIKVGVVGVGHMGHYHVNVLSMLNHNLADLVGVYDINKKRASEIAGSYDIKNFDSYEELINSVEALSIAVPTSKHFEVGKQALDNGKHILIEKPITTSTEEAENLFNIAQKKKLIVQVGHVERFNGAVQELKNIVKHPYLWEARRLGPQTGRINDVGVAHDLMIHDIDICLNTVDDDVTDVNAFGYIDKDKLEDVATAHIKFKKGCIAIITSSRLTQEKIRVLSISQKDSYIYLDFTTQDLQIHRQASSMITTSTDNIKYRQEALIERLFVHKENPLKSQFIHFLKTIKKEEKPFVVNEKDLETLRITNMIIEKIHTK